MTAIAALSMYGCTSLPLQNVQGLPGVELTATPFFADDSTLCGPTSLATLIAGQGRAADIAALTREVYVPGKAGAYQAEMIAALRRHNLIPVVIELDASPQKAARLHSLLQDGQPVLVLQKLSSLWISAFHYAVLVGFDDEEAVFVLRSGEQRRATMPVRGLLKSLHRAGDWAVVALAPERTLPVSIRENEALRAAAALEDIGLLDNARWMYEESAKRWPTNPLFSFGLANLAIQVEDWPRAIERLEALQAMHPSNIPILNNLIAALLAAGERNEAGEWLAYAFNIPELPPESRDVLCQLQQQHNFRAAACD